MIRVSRELESLWYLLLFSPLVVSNSLRPHGLQHTRLPCPSLSPRACSNSCPMSQWCHLTILSSVIPFSAYLLSFLASRSFLMSRLLASGGQSIGALASVLPMNIQGLFALGWTGWISLQSKGLSRAFSNTTVRKHQFLGAQLSLCFWSFFYRNWDILEVFNREDLWLLYIWLCIYYLRGDMN